MKKMFWLFAAMLLLLPFTAAKAGSQKGFILTQKNDFSDGETKLYVSPTGIKTSVREYTSVLRLRDDKVFILNDEKKQYSESSFEDWKKSIEKLRRITDMMGSEETTEEVGSDKVAGLETTKYVVRSTGGELSIPGLDLKSLGLGDELKMPETSNQIWVTRDIPLSPKLAQFLKTSMSQAKLPDDTEGLVVRVVSAEKGGEPTLVLDTVKYEEASIDDAMFEIPSGYKKVEGFMGLPVNGVDELVAPPENESEDEDESIEN